MKISFKSANGRLTLTVEADTAAMAFSHLSMFQEIFDHDKCGKCGSTEVRFDTFTGKGYVIHGIKCDKCSAKLNFWTNKDGSMYPNRKDKQYQPLPNNGWVVYERATTNQSATQPQWGSGAQAVQQKQPVPPSDDDSGPVDDQDIPFAWLLVGSLISLYGVTSHAWMQDLLQVWA